MDEPQIFVLRWIDIYGNILESVQKEYVSDKNSLEEARASVGLRCYQSPQKIPNDAAGFMLCPKDTYDAELT